MSTTAEPPKPPGRRVRVTIAGLLVLVAAVAVAIALLRPLRTTAIRDVKVGAGPPLRVGDTAVVHYVGTLLDGTTFDASKPRGQPFEVPVGRGIVIQGWDKGLPGMRVGGVRDLTIPAAEGYGDAGAPPKIPPGATLRFEVELLGIK